MSATTDREFKRDWASYYQAVENRPPRPTLLAALTALESANYPSRRAVDLGCGDGRDTVELLRRGWQVLAIDSSSEGIDRLKSRPDINLSLLTTQVMRFEDLQLPSPVDLINASFCLPFCSREAFPGLWAKIRAALRGGGRFCGQLFGDRDSWAENPALTTHSREQVEALLEPWLIETLEEEEHPGKTPLGEDRHWHIFHIVAAKP